MRQVRFLLPLLAAALAGAADARPLSPDEAASLDKAVGIYLRAVGRGDAEGIVAALPPRMLNVFAGATGVEVNKLKDTLVEQTASLAGETTFSDLAAKETGREADDATLPDGATVTWVVVPTSFITETGGKKARNNQSLLGLREDDKWYFLRIDGPERQQMATIAYPFLKDVSIPGAVVTPIE